MKKYLFVIWAWVLFLLFLVATEFVVFRLLYPYLFQFILKRYPSLMIRMTILIKISLLFFLFFVLVLIFSLFFTKIAAGKRLKSWFIYINKTTFGSNGKRGGS